MAIALDLLWRLLLGPVGYPSFFSVLIALLLLFGVAELLYKRSVVTWNLAILCLVIWLCLGPAIFGVGV